MYTRATTLSDAFLNAAVKKIQAGEVDANTGKGNWIARRTIIDAQQDRKIGLIREFDKRPIKNK